MTKIRKKVNEENMKKKILTMMMLGIFVFLIGGCSKAVNEKTVQEDLESYKIEKDTTKEERGNTNGNLLNGGMIAYQGEWLYFSSEGSLYKSKLDGSEIKIIYKAEENDGNIANINIIDDELYFSAGNHEKGGLYRIKDDGSDVKKLVSDTGGGRQEKVYVVGDWIYYDKKYILKKDGDGSDKKQIIEEKSGSTETFSISDGYIYYVGMNYNNEDCIYKLKMNTEAEKQEIYKRNVYDVSVEDGWIYYIDNHTGDKYGNLCRIGIDGTEGGEVIDETVVAYNINDGWIYYILKENGKNELYKMKIDGTENQKFDLKDSQIDEYYGIYVIEDWIYYMTDGVIQRIKQDNSKQEVFCDFGENIEEVKNKEKESTIEEKLVLNNTYQTRFGDVNMITFPKFAFDFPAVWNVEEEVTPTGETVTISNERGAKVTYSHLVGVPVGEDATGGSSVFMMRVEASKIEDSNFVPSYVQATDYSDLGKFVVAKLTVTGELDMKTDSDFRDVNGSVSYAVIPESLLGVDEAVRNPYSVEYGFKYGDGISFVAEAPEDGFTKEEEKCVIEILKSFRVVE
ncbi:DUF5050 domain-containing protein [Mediterraneibacter gnavus]|nr:DUF5050 domain-containing protein [Mediterraneibacter gnavus]